MGLCGAPQVSVELCGDFGALWGSGALWVSAGLCGALRARWFVSQSSPCPCKGTILFHEYQFNCCISNILLTDKNRRKVLGALDLSPLSLPFFIK